MRMSDDYLEQMRAHVDASGRLTHINAVDLLTELELTRKAIKNPHDVMRVARRNLHRVVCRYRRGRRQPADAARRRSVGKGAHGTGGGR